LVLEKNPDQLTMSQFCHLFQYNRYLTEMKTNVLLRIDQSASAIAILGILSGCSVYMSLSNLDNKPDRVDSYTIISNDYIIPRLKSLLDDFEDAFVTGFYKKGKKKVKRTKVKEKIVCLLRNEILSMCGIKKVVKYWIMPHAYNMTNVGLSKALVEELKVRYNIPESVLDIVTKDP
jgi:hypothetical protein